MLLKYIRNIEENENESDYDTAVDMVHYSFQKSDYFFETPNGAKITIAWSYESSSKSYLEPDFEDEHPQLPVGGYDSSGYEYKVFKEPEGSSSTTNYHIEVELPIEIIALTKEEFKIYLDNKERFINNQYYGSSSRELASLEQTHGLSTILLISKYQESIDPFEPNMTYPKCSKEDIEQVWSNMSQYRLKKGSSFEIEFPEILKEQIEAFDLKAKTVLESNAIIEVQNTINKQEAQDFLNSKNMKVSKLDNITHNNVSDEEKTNVSNLETFVSEKDTSKESLGSKFMNSVKKAFKR